MERFIVDELLTWKDQTRRKPLVVRGARQVGKTWSIVDFGREHFDAVHVVDLERRPEWHRIFAGDLVAAEMLSELEVFLNARIEPGRDLLFIDEIQSCPRAITALRYFYEDCPDLHVIAAGSLLEFATRDVSFPVGRVQFLEMGPMCFAEFLLATDRGRMAEIVAMPPERQPDSVHALLMEGVRRYMFVGGMPECVAAYAETGRLREAFEVQAELVNAYREDFAKYTPQVNRHCLNAVLASVARSVGRQTKYANLAEGFSNPTIKKGFDLLCLARVVRKVRAASPSGLPLGAGASERKFKALVVDIGLMQHLCGMQVEVEYARTDLLAIFQGALAEQFVGQELAAAGQSELFYWAREARNSSAEVDYLTAIDGRTRPVEVKGGAAGRLKSLHLLLKTFPDCAPGYVFSGAPYAELPEQRLVFVPLYGVYGAMRGRP